MARTEARIFTSLWDDPHFLALPPTAQRLYMFLVSQPDLTYLGTLTPRPRRWSNKAAGMSESDIRGDLDALAAARYVVVDDDAQELLVRSLLRRDEVWRQPNLLRSARKQIPLIESTAIRAAIVDELRRVLAECPLIDSCRVLVEDMLADLGYPSANPSLDPSAKGEPDAVGERGMVTVVTTGFPLPPAASQQPPDPDATPPAKPSPAAAVVLDATDATPAEAQTVAERVRTTRKPRSLPALLRSMPVDELQAIVDEIRAESRRADVSAQLAAIRAGPTCARHDDAFPAGNHPVTGEPMCPQCRAERRVAA